MPALTTESLTRRFGGQKAVDEPSTYASHALCKDRKPILQIVNLSKGFDKVAAVGSIYFHVFKGEIFA